MTLVRGNKGHLYIKYSDPVSQPLYLTEELTFSTDRSRAAKFYPLKSADTSIINGDRISLHTGSRTLVINHSGIPQLLDRTQIRNEISTFVIMNGTDNTQAIECDDKILLVGNRENMSALRYNLDHGRVPYMTYDKFDLSQKRMFSFSFENAFAPMTQRKTVAPQDVPLSSRLPSWLNWLSGPLVVILLIIILILSVLTTRI
jgi:hypothetical protein